MNIICILRNHYEHEKRNYVEYVERLIKGHKIETVKKSENGLFRVGELCSEQVRKRKECRADDLDWRLSSPSETTARIWKIT